MHAAKLIPIILLAALALATGVFFFIPSLRPAMVDRWFKSAQGFSPATSAEDALDQFRRAIEKRDYRTAKDYLTGDYLELFAKGSDDARELVRAVDELSDVMKSTGVKSDKVDVMLFWLNPLPTFKYDVNKNKSSGGVTAVIHWNEDAARLREGLTKLASERYTLNPLMLHSLLPVGSAIPPAMTVVVKESNGVWKIDMPVRAGDRHLRDTVDALRKNATNYRNALQDIKGSIKNNPAVKEDFEREFKSNLEKAN